ncbi:MULTISPECIES: hypothetical protein [Rhizobium]|uniref:hypothetical protein n=1 Tax=Rhizobium TaxID=379 RepID=UPI001B333689|nr:MULTISPECIES: hypothetical protein [Rhizobium]MBX4908811.1 hypothetical protein [Rhizobium bangladeshense]MBX5215946.1 hypothetical protein [Rhizobium sp. NLR9a]MBX5234323.1 hypothetical protein [Rhizobium sp. NLR4a]MBX5246644.1 hypothetical protein [Rhizobium sp. NLR3b]MBX5251325.1 hypothetical protein [Rhizobium sp. NLR4b]
MTSELKIGQLQETQIERAYVVAQAAMPRLTLASWRQVTSGSERRNFIVAADIDDRVRGLCHARIENHPLAGRLFDVAIFIVVSAFREQEIAAKLFSNVRNKAIDANCNYLRVWTLRPENWSLLDDREYRHRWDHGSMHPL